MHLIIKLSLLLVVTEKTLRGDDCRISCQNYKDLYKCKAVKDLCARDIDKLCFQKKNSTCCCFDKVVCRQVNSEEGPDKCKLAIWCTGNEVCKVGCVDFLNSDINDCCCSVGLIENYNVWSSCRNYTICSYLEVPQYFDFFCFSDCFCDLSDCLKCSCAKSSCETTTGNIFTSDAGEISDITSTVSTTEDNMQNTDGTSAMTYAEITSTSERNTGTVATVVNTNTLHINSTREPDSQNGDSVPAAIVVGVLVAIVAFAAIVVGVLYWYKRSRAFHKREGIEDTEHKPTFGINDDTPGSPINPYAVPDARPMGSSTKNEHVYCTLTDEKDNNAPVLDSVSPNGVYSLATNIPNTGVDRNMPNAPVPEVVYSLATNIPNTGVDRNLPNAPVPEVVYSLATNIFNAGAERNLPSAPVQEQEYSLAKNVQTKEKCAAGSDINSDEVNSQYFILESEHDRNDQYTTTEVPNNNQYFILEEQSETDGVLSEMKAIQPDVNIHDTEYCALEPMDTSKHDADYTQLKQNSPKEEIIPDYFELEPDSSM